MIIFHTHTPSHIGESTNACLDALPGDGNLDIVATGEDGALGIPAWDFVGGECGLAVSGEFSTLGL